jgi:N-methylhydantoinase A/oxoprolinase/acetone carboxylase beta subunit
MARNDYILAVDAGGTMTDTMLIDQEGQFSSGKAPTTTEGLE